jgi:16S rRNA (cytosine1402-N4)-methyltransferase
MEALLAPAVFHRPALVAEVTALLEPRDGGVYFDGTLGGGGHAAAILRVSGPTGRLYGTDRDPEAIAEATRRLAGYEERFQAERGGFEELDRLEMFEGPRFDGAVLDLGVSSHQIDTPERGFTFDADAPLDMRMGPGGPTAADLLNTLSVAELAEIFRRYGEEPFAGPIARAVAVARRRAPVATSAELREILRAAVPARFRPAKVYARAFQALRIAVNQELTRLESGLPVVFGRLRPGGRLAVLAYHSLEDRIVKGYFRALEQACICPPGLPVCGCGRIPVARLVTRRPVTPGVAEIAQNPRARSARLRVVARLADTLPPAAGSPPADAADPESGASMR